MRRQGGLAVAGLAPLGTVEFTQFRAARPRGKLTVFFFVAWGGFRIQGSGFVD